MAEGKSKGADARVVFRWLSYVTAVVAMSCRFLSASPADGKLVANNTPSYVASAKNLGAENPAKLIEVSIWLQLHNRSEFDALTQSLYDRTSPNYHHWLKPSDIATRFAPTAQEVKTLQEFIAAHNLQLVKTGPINFYVRARGTVGDVEKAFQVQLNNYQVGDKMIRANASDPFVEGTAGPLVRAVSGLDTGEFEHTLVVRPISLGRPKSAATAQAMAVSNPDFFSAQCFTGTEKESFSTNGDGELPIGTYSGNKLNLESRTSPGCGYTPAEIQTAHNLTGLYNKGFNGAGQTIAIVDWCGSFSIQDDANAFSTQFGLPQLTSSNFNIIYTAHSECITFGQTEINLDVEWAHAIAPGANINLVVPPSPSFQDVDEAEFDVANRGLGNVLSGSFGFPEAFLAATEVETESLIAEIGAANGISFNYSSGDSGNFEASDGFLATVSSPADSPWATAVGGVTLALNSDNSIAWQAGWGNVEALLAQEGTVFDPPVSNFFAGSGGGPSNCVTKTTRFGRPLCTGGFPKPSYQQGFVPGTFRQLPDISWLADPFTGAVILISIPGQFPEQVFQVVGGTSLAAPMFSALWAIANQEAVAGGGTELGQAAPYLYSLPAGTVYDIVPVTSKTNVTGSIQDSNGITKYTAAQLVKNPPEPFVSALWDAFNLQETAFILSFGTDLGLHTNKGWDNVTGMGTPNAQAFADFFFGK